jgi:hypothetical protein
MDFLLLFIKLQSHLTLCILVKSTVIQCFALFAHGAWIWLVFGGGVSPSLDIPFNRKPRRRAGKVEILNLNTHQQISKFAADKVCFILISLARGKLFSRARVKKIYCKVFDPSQQFIYARE